MLYLKADTNVEVLVGPAVAVGDGFTPVTTLSLSTADEAELIKYNGATALVVTSISANTMSAITGADGYYTLDLSTSNLDTEGPLTILINDDSLILPIRMDFMVVNANVYDSLFAAATTDYLQTDVAQWLGNAVTASSGNPDVNIESIDANAITAASIATDAIDAAALATDAVDEIADGVWDEDILAAHTTTATAGLILANTRNLATGAGGISVTMSSHTATDVGTETNSETDTTALNGTYHICPPGVDLDMYYEFNVGVTGIATEAIWDGYVTTNNDVCEVYGYDWVAAGWVQIGSINGTSGTTPQEKIFILDNTMTGTGADVGKVRVRFDSDGVDKVTNVATDRLLVEYTSLPGAGVDLHDGVAQASTSNTITLDATASATDDYYNHARVVITEGTGSEQERIITDYNGTTKVATIAPPWSTNPDTTSVFIVEPALAHAETDMDTIKIGLAAAGTSTTITLDSNASATDDFYNGDLILIDAGTGLGQVRVITDYTGATKVATVHTAWSTTPDTTSEYIVEAAHPYMVDIEADAAAIVLDTGTDGVVIASGQTVATVTDVTNEVSADVTKISGDATAADNLEASMETLVTGTATGGDTGEVQSAVTGHGDDTFNGRVLIFRTGTLQYEAGVITDYDSTAGTFTFAASTWTTSPTTETFVIV
jgi:hypothetical protein